MSTQTPTLSDGYNRVPGSQATFHDSERGIVIDLWEREYGGLLQDYPYVVAAAKNQRKEYMGVFKDREAATEKAVELTHTL